MAATLHLDGLPEEAVTLGLVALREKLTKARKLNDELKRDTESIDELDEAAADLLKQLGYVEPKKRKGANVGEVTRDDGEHPDQIGMEFKPAPRSRVECLTCGGRFAVPVGDHQRKCPDCGTIHRVKSDEDGEIFMRRIVVEPPDEIRKLFIMRASDDLPPLTPADQKTLEAWIAENPDYTTNAELIPTGDRVADPERPGSGNEIEVNCHSLIGNECDGFKTTDTPGESVCPKCGQKYTVEILDGEDGKPRALVRPYAKPDDEAAS
jgi:Zn finger protein HypA/HybF involved in hydrogenase expression